jgi:hypothetical protein
MRAFSPTALGDCSFSSSNPFLRRQSPADSGWIHCGYNVVSPSRPGDRKVGGLRLFLGSCYISMPSLRSSTVAARRQRIVSGENRNVNGIPFALRSGLPSRRTR